MARRTEKRGEREKQLQRRPYLGEAGAPSHGGRAGGDVQRDIATEDEEKRSFERPAGATRVRHEDKKSRT